MRYRITKDGLERYHVERFKTYGSGDDDRGYWMEVDYFDSFSRAEREVEFLLKLDKPRVVVKEYC
jgi:hypothetical protein